MKLEGDFLTRLDVHYSQPGDKHHREILTLSTPTHDVLIHYPMNPGPCFPDRLCLSGNPSLVDLVTDPTIFTKSLNSTLYLVRTSVNSPLRMLIDVQYSVTFSRSTVLSWTSTSESASTHDLTSSEASAVRSEVGQTHLLFDMVRFICQDSWMDPSIRSSNDHRSVKKSETPIPQLSCYHIPISTTNTVVLISPLQYCITLIAKSLPPWSIPNIPLRCGSRLSLVFVRCGDGMCFWGELNWA